MKKVALVHDYLYTYGGAERVLEALKKIYPKAPVYTAWVDWTWLKKTKPEWKNWQIKTSWFDKLPFKKTLCSPLRFLTPFIWKSFDLKDYDLVISSSAWYMSKGAALNKKKKGVKNNNDNKSKAKNKNNKPFHLCYCHTPPRYLYNYPTALNFKKYWWGRLYSRIVNPFMRYYDFKSSQAIDQFVCNSREVQQRIKKFYRRESEIINPPLMFSNNKNKDKTNKTKIKKQTKNPVENNNYFLMVNRLVAPKHTSLAIKACLKLKENLIIVGTGPEEEKLKKLAKDNPLIKFSGFVPDKKLKEYYKNCQAVLYLAEDEDFGIIPIEAAWFGKPVIALNQGGIKETVIDKKTGLFINNLDLKELVKVLKNFQAEKFDPQTIKNHSRQFSEKNFIHKFKKLIRSLNLKKV
jgi:glycosyltransferase involved in cell wall biosynthesis